MKRSLNSGQVEALVRCFTEWASAERLRVAFESAQSVREGFVGKRVKEVECDSEFMSDLESL